MILLTISSSLVTRKLKAILFLKTPPHSNKLIKFFIKSSSLSCWVNLNSSLTIQPILVLLLNILIMNEPSPEVNPAIQFGSGIRGFSTIGLTTGTTSGKANLTFSDKPRFIEALIATIFRNPSKVKCSLRWIFSTTLLKKLKSEHFWVIKGYLSKWSIITFNSLINRTCSWTAEGPRR